MKSLVLLLLLTLAGGQLTAQTDSVAVKTVADSAVVMTKADSLVAFAKQQLGKPYQYAHAGPAGFDCSGFVSFVFANFHIALPRSSRDYMTTGVEVPLSECRKGDVIVFTGTHAGDRRAGHVGIIISEAGQPVQFIHASSSDKHRGVVITDYAGSHYPKRFIKIIRVM